MDSEKKDLMIKTYRQFMEIGLGDGDPDKLSQIADEKIVGFGTAIDEKILGIEQVKQLLQIQKAQSKGFELLWRSIPISHYTSDDEQTAVFADDLYLTIKAGAESIEMYLRFSVVLNYVDGQWKVIHWHGSKPEHVESEKDTWGLDVWKQKAAELEQLVEEKTADLLHKNRELQIESALEKVRTVAMGMKAPEDMLSICQTIAQQLEGLGLEHIRNVQTAIFYPDRGTYMNYEYYAMHDKTLVTEVDYQNHPIQQSFADKMMTGPGEEVREHLSGQKMRDWHAFQKTTNQFVDDYILTAESLNYYWFSLGPVALGTSTYAPLSPKEIDLFKRFIKVFELAYQRYLDIEKALSQARQAQIEAALEKVRSRSLAMHKSSELSEVVHEFYIQLQKLVFEYGACTITLIDGNTGDTRWWMAGLELGQYPDCYEVKYFNHPGYEQILEGWKNHVDFLVVDIRGESKTIYDKYFFTQTGFQQLPEFVINSMRSLDHVTYSLAYMKYGALSFGPNDTSEDQRSILKRFANVFEQAYTRFLDLQKAEAQAREAQIEAALERVRSRGMGMQKSHELSDVIQVVYNQMAKLNLPVEHTGFILDYKTRNDYPSWIADHLGSPSHIVIPYFKASYYDRFNQAKAEGAAFFAVNLDFDEKNRFYQDLFRHLPGFPEDSKAFILGKPALTISTVLLDDVALYIENFSGLPFSDHENSVLMRFGKVFQQTYTRFLDLQKAELQAREAQIEAALERVRARAMAMHSSQELKEVVYELRKQMGILGQKELETCVIHLHDESAEYIQSWAGISPPDSDGETLEATASVPKKGLLIIEEALAAYAAKRQEYVIRNEGEKLVQWFSFLEKASPEGFQKLADSVHGNIEELSSYWSFADFNGGSLLMVTRDEPDEPTRRLLGRFSQVFGLAYRRFADLKQAEAQAREAQIEAALERVRSKTMAMHNSQDVGESVATLFEELVGLGVLHPEERCGIGIMLPDQQMEAWTAAKIADGKAELTIGLLDMTLHPLLASAYNGWVDKKEINQYILEGEDRRSYYEAMLTQPSYKITRDHYTGHIRIYHNDFYFKEGCLYVFAERELPKASLTVYTRFAAVFGQTYRRYQDLLKAEAQAREAQIEAALESIRSKAMAMRNSEDISETTAASFAELKKLGISSFRSGVGILTKGSRMAQVFADTRAEDGQLKALSTLRSMDEHPALQQQYQAWEKQEDYEQFLSGDELTTYYSHPFFQKSNIDLEKKKENHQECGYYFAFPDGLFYSWSYQPYTEAEKSILRRFRNIVSLTFRRYLDLQKAEAQAREATKQASLDRVRAVIASMRSAEDLELITPLIFKELTILDVPFIRCGVFIIHENRQIIDAYLSSPSGASLGVLHLPYRASELTMQTVESWRAGRIHRQHWNQADFIAWTKQMMEQHQIESSRSYQGADTAPESLDLHFVPFDQGMLYVGSLQALGDQDLELVLALAKSFSIAYARYEDFVKLETAKANIESTLTELKSTQAQLIQQEKLASLGQLTAGIAHEIQNPLNFVNNFSEINAELSEEMLEAIEKGDLEEARVLATDMKANQEKIRDHGKRADSIVKGMLQHSRSSAGAKEPTDITALADEYLRLAYHGLRAKDKTFNASIKTEFEPNLPKVPLVAQDIGRVLLNLFNNAFYAVNERKKIEGDGFEPEVRVGVRAGNTRPDPSILIAVSDNGTGIPETIREKIFQPFFTTKPTGQGTGLGLSLSYDIVKAHGGELKVASKAGEGSIFHILLPVSSA